MSKKRLKEIDIEMARLKKEQKAGWMRSFFNLKKEREEIVSKIGKK